MERWRWGGVARGKTENLCVSKQESQICEEEVPGNKEEREAEPAFGPDRWTSEQQWKWAIAACYLTQHLKEKEKKKTGGLFTVSTSCLSLKHDQKHTHTHAHLVISVKYSFNKVCVVKTMPFYRLRKNQRRAQIDPLFHNASANTRHAGATMETQTHKTPETGETSVVIQHRR